MRLKQGIIKNDVLIKLSVLIILLLIIFKIFRNVVRTTNLKKYLEPLGINTIPVKKDEFFADENNQESFIKIKNQNDAQIIAEKQYGAMLDFGTDENQLFGALLDLNDIELKAVYNAFGLKSYSLAGKSFLWGKEIDLIAWYHAELDKKELVKMKLIWINTGLWYD